MKHIELKPIKESKDDFDEVERKLKDLFKKEIYFPILKELQASKSSLQNARGNPLLDALLSGRITFSKGTFSGRFDSGSTKELKRLGAEWDRRTGTWKAPLSSLPREVRTAISSSDFRFQEKLQQIDKRLTQILPDEVAGKIKVSDNFDRALWKTDQSFQSSVKGIAVAPQLTKEQRKKIADEWQNNMELWIKDFSEKQITKLRKDLQKSSFVGNRYGSLIETLQSSYGVSANKAKFLARQETGLLMAKFKETRYLDAGVKYYKWTCVAGTKAHPVRPAHQALGDRSKKGELFRFDDPPNTAPAGHAATHNNPGEDYNCRCFAIPVIKVNK